jgi:uroporphyrinogen decarboxylase
MHCLKFAGEMAVLDAENPRTDPAWCGLPAGESGGASERQKVSAAHGCHRLAYRVMNRRAFLVTAAAPILQTRAAATMQPRERVDAALAGKTVDRPPFTLWYHFGLEKDGPAAHAKATLDFHERFGTDLVKVMSDFPFPKPAGNWWEVRVVQNPFEPQIRALGLIRDGLNGRKHFVETIFNPWNVAEKLSSKEEVARTMREQPQRLLSALEAIARSEAAHAKRAVQAGASGVFLAIANAQDGIMTEAEYAKFSEPFDRMVLDAVKAAPLNILHLHGDKVYLNRFLTGWPPAVVQYSAHGTGVEIAALRKRFPGVIMGGIDERKFRDMGPEDFRKQAQQARAAAGAKFILAPGCSVPNETTDAEIRRFLGVVTRL